jgi:hypothetical protein
MKHYDIIRWVDFARGVVTNEQEVRMREHLATGCVQCGQIVDFCSLLADTCRNTGPAEVPDWALRRAIAIFPVRSSRNVKRSHPIPVELIYDSFLSPAPVGLRSSWQVGWQGLYHAGECSLDLRIEPELKSSRAAVIGQITNRALPPIEVANIAVCLKLGKQVVVETVSNRFGEFQMEYEQQGRLQLCVYLEGGAKRIQVPLRKLAADHPLGGNRFKLGKNPKKSPNGSLTQ